MILWNYTPENICRALGMDGFANDSHLAKADESIRLLLIPSFEPEVCISFTKDKDGAMVRVVTARSQIWRQNSQLLKRTDTDSAFGAVSLDDYYGLAELLETAADGRKRTSYVICGGMRVYSFLRLNGERKCELDWASSEEESYSEFIKKSALVA